MTKIENETIVQPLDTLMTRLGLTNADLVRASTEQLSFKMVQKGRSGRRLTRNIQEKILNALREAKPGLKMRRRDLFHYAMDEDAVKKIDVAIALIADNKIKYPGFIDLLLRAGVHHYAVNPAADQITFYGSVGEVRIMEDIAASQIAAVIRSAIDAMQKKILVTPAFLKRVRETSSLGYDANLHNRRIIYQGESSAYSEDIPAAPESEISDEPMAVPEKITATIKPANKKPGGRKKRPGVVRTTRKARLSARKRYFKKKRRR